MTDPGEGAERPRRLRITRRPVRGLPLRAVAPNAVTALALCFGLSGVRFAIAAQWDKALLCVIIAAVLDGMDGRVARLLNGESRFGAELDSLSDVIAFGVTPGLIVYLWSLSAVPRWGWLFALAHALCCALRLARFNAQIDTADKPLKTAGFFTGIPAPAGAAVLFLPMYLWLAGRDGGLIQAEWLRAPWVTIPWTALTAFLMISQTPTYGWSAMRLRRGIRLPVLFAIAMAGAALVTAPWETLSMLTIAYVATIPFSIRAYSRIRRQRASVRTASTDMAAPSA